MYEVASADWVVDWRPYMKGRFWMLICQYNLRFSKKHVTFDKGTLLVKSSMLTEEKYVWLDDRTPQDHVHVEILENAFEY